MEEKARADHISITNSNELNYDDYSNSYKNQPELDDELFNEKPDLSLSSISRYFATRLTTLLDLPLYHTHKNGMK